MVNLLIYLAATATWYQFLLLPVILMILLYLAAPFLTAPSCFCLAYSIHRSPYRFIAHSYHVMILKLELSVSSPVATSLEVSMPLHQPTTFSFPKHQFSKSKLVVRSFKASWFRSWSCTDRYIIIRWQMVTVPFAFYVCAMASSEKMSSGNANTAFVSNCDHNYNYVARQLYSNCWSIV